MLIDDQNLKEILLKQSYLSWDELAKAVTDAQKRHVALLNYLLDNGLVTKQLLGQAIAEFLHVSYIDLESKQPTAEQVTKIPQAEAQNLQVVLAKEEAGEVTVATPDPNQADLVNKLQPIFPGLKIQVAFAFPDDIQRQFASYRKPLATRFSEILKSGVKVAPEIIDEIFRDATTLRASDIHFEPRDADVGLRFRVDGVLSEVGRLSKENYENILNSLKVLAGMRIDEHFRTQDGACRYKIGENLVDMRLSVAPTISGEKVVIRLLSSYVKDFSLANLGLSEANQALLTLAAHKPFGMILVTGPTGSGKTTTLYAVLKTLNNPEVNITTIEDPVEYKVLGVNQIQVNDQTGVTFAAGLRSIIRQDPNIILVGEIRDQETAEISVNAALTGHLLLSSFHANDAATAIPRLMELGVEPFLLSSTLEAVLAQRLVRKVCESCRVSYSGTAPFSPTPITLYKGKGCRLCNNTGFSGRTAIFEFIDVSPELKQLILAHPSAAQIQQLVLKQGGRTMFQDGIDKVERGITTVEELLRVAAPAK